MVLQAMVRDPLAAGTHEPDAPCAADLGAAAFVLVIGGDVSDRGVQADRVVLDADDGELGAKHCGVGDRVEVWPVGLDVAEQALDPCLVGRGAGPAEVLRDRAHGHELPGRAGGHLRTVVTDSEQDRPANRIIEERIGDAVLMSGDELVEALKLQGVAERGLDLGAGLLAGDDFADPICG